MTASSTCSCPCAGSVDPTRVAGFAAGVGATVAWYALPDYVRSRPLRGLVKAGLLGVLGWSMVAQLPEGAELAPGDIQPTSRTDEPSADVPESAACTIVLGGHDYDYSAVYADAPMPAPDGNLPEVTWQVGGLKLLLYADGAVGWYDAAAGIQWYCVAWDGGQPLVTAFALMDAQSYTVPTAPEGAAVQGYDLFELDGETVTQVRFTLNGITWQYRMAPTDDVSETIPDISEFTGGSLTAESTVRWCTALLRWDEGGAGCIIWRDMAPGLVYSLTTDSGASEDALSDMAALVFQPAQDES